jgi:hypothetical protein
MEQTLRVSDVRRQLHRLLASLRQQPERRYQIVVHGTVVGQLIAAPSIGTPGAAARALLRLSRQAPRRARRHPSRISEEHDRYLYAPRRSRG